MENQIIQGKELGTFEAISVSLGTSKNENRDGKKSHFAVFVYQSTYSGGAKPVKDIQFEDDLGATNYEALKKYVMKDADGNTMKDSKGGAIVDIDAIFDKADQDEKEGKTRSSEIRLRNLYLVRPGGMVEPFKLQGERYANDVDGKPVLNKQGERVKKQVIRVFVQVQNIRPGDDGKPVTQYVGGISPEVRGLELQDRFYREVVPITAPAVDAKETDDNDAF